MGNARNWLTLDFLAQSLLILTAYFIAAHFQISPHSVHPFTESVWAGMGLGLAVLLLGGYRFLPIIFLGLLIPNILNPATPIDAALIIAFGTTLKAWLGAYILDHFFDFSPRFEKLNDALGIVFVALIVTTVSGAVGAIAFLLYDLIPLSELATLWAAWWVGDALGILIVVPFLVRWIGHPQLMWPLRNYIEGAAVTLLIAELSILVFWFPVSDVAGIPIFYAVLFPLIWIALRLGPRFMTLALFVLGVTMTTGVIFGDPSVLLLNAELDPLRYQIAVGIIATFFLIFVSVAKERQMSMDALQRHVENLEQELQEVSLETQAKTNFLATLAHELRNPLSPLLSSIELMKFGNPSPAEKISLLELMENRVLVIGRLLDDLLDVAKIARKKLELRKELLDVRAIIERVTFDMAPHIKANGQQFTLSIPEEPLWVKADPVRLEQILTNLLTNAIKYTERGGSISITAEKNRKKLTLRVRDSGKGIPPDMLTNIFEPFFQIKAEKGETPGLGIGLSLTKKLVEMHRGSITVRSGGLGKGSEFIIQLPLTPQVLTHDEEAPEVQDPHTQGSTARPLRILVVDDNEAAAQGLKELLSLHGHDVAVAYHGSGALAANTEFDPNILILDIGLPDMSGYELAQQLRASGSDATLIALTGYGQAEDKRKAEEAGFDHHLTKPVGITDLQKVLVPKNA